MSKLSTNGFGEYRYYKSKLHEVPKLAFRFEVSYSPVKEVPASVRFSYAICNGEDNFCRATARKILDERMEAGNVLVGDFRGREASLVETAMGIVDGIVNTFDDDEEHKQLTKSNPKLLRKFNNLKKLRESYNWITGMKNIESMLGHIDFSAVDVGAVDQIDFSVADTK